MAKFLKGIINSELHNFDVTDNTAISTTENIFRLTGMAEGDDSVGRTGRSIMVKSVQVRHRGVINASATATTVRILIGMDSQTNVTLPTAAELFATTSEPSSLRNLDTDRGRIKILMDKTINLSINGNRIFDYQKFIPLGNHHVYYDATTANQDAKGKLFVCLLSNEATNTVGQVMNCRVRYYDN